MHRIRIEKRSYTEQNKIFGIAWIFHMLNGILVSDCRMRIQEVSYL